MEYDYLSLAEGFLLGEDDGFSQNFKILVKKTGALHLVAASGANLVFLERIFEPIGSVFSYRLRRWFFLALMVVYSSLVGESGSLWRAMIMWVLSWGGCWFGRKSSLEWLLFLVLIVTFCFQFQLLSSASFWLSWLAMVGVVFSHRVVVRENKIEFFSWFLQVLNYLKQSFFTGWVVFLAVTPWLLGKYGVFQPYGILVTWGIEPFVLPYMVAAVFGKILLGVDQVTGWSSFVGAASVMSVLYEGVERWLRWWQWFIASFQILQLVLVSCVVIGGWVSFVYWKNWCQQKWAKLEIGENGAEWNNRRFF